MISILRAVALAGAATVLTGTIPHLRPEPSAQTLAMLDPTRQALAFCGKGKGPTSLRHRLQLAALLASPAAAAAQGPAILYPGLDGLHFPISANAQARPFFL